MIKEVLKEKSIRNKVLFTFFALGLFCVGSNIAVPGVNPLVLRQLFSNGSGLFDMFNLFTGGSFQHFTIFALGVTPYITASIIVQLLTVALPYFENLSNDGMTGRKKMATITRYLAVLMALIQAIGVTFGLFNKAIINKTTINMIAVILLITAGTAFLMWLGEQINEYGLGNGISLLIFAGILMKTPSFIGNIITQYKAGKVSIIGIIAIIVVALALTTIVIFMQFAVRKIPVLYGQRTTGRKVYGTQHSFIPIKVNTAGVIPIIFAMSMLQVPLTIAFIFPATKYGKFILRYLSPDSTVGIWVYLIANTLLVLLFTIFYTNIAFKTKEVADGLRNSKGFIPGLAPGKVTENYLQNISNRLCFISAIFLALMSSIPTLMSQFTPIKATFGGTSLLILVGVAIDTMTKFETYISNQYKEYGFLTKKRSK